MTVSRPSFASVTPVRRTGSALGRGLLAGAAGTAVLDVVSYLDMVVRGRPASEMPRSTVQAALGRLGVQLPGDRDQQASRGTALGALAGLGTGLGVGVLMATGRSAGLRLSPLGGAVLTSAAAMAATDGPAAALGVTDLRHWSVQDWASDVLPHLAYGAVAHGVARTLEQKEPTHRRPTRPSARLLVRSLLLGVATGSRSSLGMAAAAFVAGRSRRTTAARGVSVAAVGTELFGDKAPQTPSRLASAGMAPRIVAGTVGVTALAARENATADLPVLAGLLGVLAGAFGGAAWRAATTQWAIPAALAEDALAVSLAVVACRL